MRCLREYEFKSVQVILTNGKVYRGFVDTYTSAADNDDTEESIGVMPSRTAREGVELYASDIQSIELLD